MPKNKNDEKEAKFVALLRVTWPGDYQEVRSFDTAWHLSLEKAEVWGTPVKTEFLLFVRKD